MARHTTIAVLAAAVIGSLLAVWVWLVGMLATDAVLDELRRGRP